MKTPITVNTKNSINLNGTLYITALKATHVHNDKATRKFLNYNNKINHPKMGLLVAYEGFYKRNPIYIY